MKKLFFVLAVSGVLVACNSNSGSTEEKKDTGATATPAATPAPASTDTTAKAVDTTAKAAVDTTKK